VIKKSPTPHGIELTAFDAYGLSFFFRAGGCSRLVACDLLFAGWPGFAKGAFEDLAFLGFFITSSHDYYCFRVANVGIFL
jgi:hypothetical protein